MIVTAVIFAILLGALIFIVLPRASVARRTVSVSIFLALIAIVYGGATEILGWPKPLRLEWRNAEKAQVLSAVPVENEAIYVWLMMPNSRQPRSYVLPWSQGAAQELQDATNKAEADGTAVEMTSSETGDDEGEPMFYARPQPPLPAKNYDDGGQPLVYPQPGDGRGDPVTWRPG
jgi:hypothetical protein